MLFKILGRNTRKWANIHIERIVYVSIDNQTATFHMKDSKMIDTRMQLNQINKNFPDLLRLSASYLVNEREIRAIEEVGRNLVVKLSTDEKLIVDKFNKVPSSFFRQLSSKNSGDEGEDQ